MRMTRRPRRRRRPPRSQSRWAATPRWRWWPPPLRWSLRRSGWPPGCLAAAAAAVHCPPASRPARHAAVVRLRPARRPAASPGPLQPSLSLSPQVGRQVVPGHHRPRRRLLACWRGGRRGDGPRCRHRHRSGGRLFPFKVLLREGASVHWRLAVPGVCRCHCGGHLCRDAAVTCGVRGWVVER